MNEGDELLAMIRAEVSQQPLAAPQQEMVTHIVAHTVIAVLSNPSFLNRLLIVQRLQQENMVLRQNLMQVQAFLRQQKVPVKKAAAKKPRKAGAKKTVAKSPTVKVRGSTTANRRAFKQGYRGA